MSTSCPSCEAENTTTAKFCIKCGAPLPRLEASVPPPPTDLLSDGAESQPKSEVRPPQSTTVEQALPFGTVKVDVSITPPPPPPPPPPRMGAPSSGSGSGNSGTQGGSGSTAANSKGGSKAPLLIGVAAVVVGGAGFWFFLSNNQETAKSSATVVQQAAPSPGAAAPAGATTRDVLNELLGLARDNRWKEVPAKAGSLKSMTSQASGNRAQSESLHDEGRQQLETNPEAAERVLMRAVAADPSNAQARFSLVRSLLAQGKADQATLTLVDAVSLAPDQGAGWLLAAEVFAESNKPDVAISALKLAVFYARNREGALNTLQNPEGKIASKALIEVINTALPTLIGVPPRK